MQRDINETMPAINAKGIAMSKAPEVTVVAKNFPMPMELGGIGAEGHTAVGGDLDAGGRGCPNR